MKKKTYTKEDVLESLVRENRGFRQEIMIILYRLILGLCITIFIITTGFVVVTHIYFHNLSNYNYKPISISQDIKTNKNENIIKENNSKRTVVNNILK